MFNVGGAELFVILLLALVVLGPDKLPGAMRTVGQWAGEMRKMANGFQAEMNKAIADPLDTKGAEQSTETKAGAVAPDTDVSADATKDDRPADAADGDGSGTNGSSSNSSSTNGSVAPAERGTTTGSSSGAIDEGPGDQPETST